MQLLMPSEALRYAAPCRRCTPYKQQLTNYQVQGGKPRQAHCLHLNQARHVMTFGRQVTARSLLTKSSAYSSVCGEGSVSESLV